MKVCIPVQENRGFDSNVHGHFGSAGYFIVHDTEKGETKALSNPNQEHAPGQCHPIAVLQGEAVEAVIVGGIGRRAIEGFNASGIRVYQSAGGTVRENINAFLKKGLVELTPETGCSQHGHGGGCG